VNHVCAPKTDTWRNASEDFSEKTMHSVLAQSTWMYSAEMQVCKRRRT